MKIFASIRGVLAGFVLIFNAIIFPIPLLLIYCLSRLLPLKSWRHASDTILQKAPYLWTVFNNVAITVNGTGPWVTQLPDNLKKDKPYLVIANHQTWVDILVLYRIFNYKIPPLKFFMKKELLWMLPMAGITCKVMGYPFMERHSRKDIRKDPSLRGKDIETTRLACKKFSKVSSSLMNFIEGTRFQPQKKQRQGSPFQYLLKPKAGGVSIVLEEMRPILAGILDVTIVYESEDLGVWTFLKGGYGAVHVEVREIPITDDLIGDYYADRQFRPKLQAWLNNLWSEKDQRIKEIKQTWQ